ncbi:peptidase M50 [Albimonas sp. CAU 1670]|uniref:PqqD family peptide modification chaperone n=1 Tax=Albimonas sp. CAU 1670 TaxID=3032599 RepID=UPI0023DB8452|nr:PqqD family peptide modification chaperone [Albimonas sp. CAU 1670]MDF2234973.1 peptidase M50 [Albimonas sp. CAU 1670]
MAKSFLSPSWYRVADLRPRLRSQAEIHRQVFRGQTWYVVQDHQSGRFFRLSPAANLIVCLMDGRRSMQALWDHACRTFPDDPPTQDEVIRLLSQMHSSDLLQGEIAPDMAELERRASKQKSRDLLSRIRNPLAMRFPLLDPDRFLEATLPLVRWIFSPVGLLLWAALVATGATLAVMNFRALGADVADRVLAADNLLILFLAYPLVKAVHELGHGYAAKAFGGEVHEMGVMMLVFMPVPYVDATSSAAFPSKWKRALVGAAGIMVELALAAAAMIFWLQAEPGIARAFAFNVMLIGGVSTLLFNGNPLLRFDGYYVFSDLIGIPNLGMRSNKQVFHLIRSRLLGDKSSESPATAPGEPWIFVVYSVSAFVYRIGITLTIALFVAQKFFSLGIILAAWSVGSMFVFPLFKGARWLVSSRDLSGRRGRALAVTGAFVGAILAGLLALPLPLATMAQGVVWAPEGAVLRTAADGFVAEIAPEGPGPVAAGAPLLRLEDPSLDARIEVLEAQRRELELRLGAARVLDRVQADALAQQIEHVEGALALAAARRDALVLRAPQAGAFVSPHSAEMPGRFLPKGAEVGYVVRPEELVLRVIVPQSSVDLLRTRPGPVSVRFASDPEAARDARVLRQAPAASHELPSLALAARGGGTLAVDPSDPEGQRLLRSAFQLELATVEPAPSDRVGERVFVRFDHGSEPVAFRLWRATRQLFLASFDV